MSRIVFRNLWLIILLGLVFMSWNFFQKGQENNKLIYRKNIDLARLYKEKKEAEKVFVALAALDKRTINETTATQLSLLRHLELEKKDYTFTVLAKQRNDIGGVPFFLRRVQVEAEVSYPEALLLMDNLHTTNKISLDGFILKRSNELGDRVRATVTGTMYGLDKNE